MGWISSLKYDLIRFEDREDALFGEGGPWSAEDPAELAEETTRTALNACCTQLQAKIEDRWGAALDDLPQIPSADTLVGGIADKLETALAGKVTREAKAEAAAEALDAVADDLQGMVEALADRQAALRAAWEGLFEWTGRSADDPVVTIKEESWEEIKDNWTKKEQVPTASHEDARRLMLDMIMTVAKTLRARWLEGTAGEADLVELESFLRSEL